MSNRYLCPSPGIAQNLAAAGGGRRGARSNRAAALRAHLAAALAPLAPGRPSDLTKIPQDHRYFGETVRLSPKL